MATASGTKKRKARAAKKTRTNNKKKRTAFKVSAEAGSEVYVAGDFNDWNPKKNRLKFKSGSYSANVMLVPGKYEYKFVIDGVWCVDPECAEWAPNGLGSLNSVINVG